MRGPAIVTAAVLLAPAAKADLLHCRMLMDLASPTLGQTSSGAVEALDEGCVYLDLRSEGLQGEWPALQAASLTVKGAGFSALVDEGAPPRSLTLEIRGLELLPSEDLVLPRWSRALLAQQAPVNVIIAYGWDEALRRVQVETFDIDFGANGKLHLSGAIDEVDLRSRDTAAVSIGSLGLTELRVEFTTLGLFEDLILPLIAPRLLTDFASPEAGIEVLKASALEALSKIPPSILDPASFGALTAFVADLPEPQGILTLEVAAAPGIGAPRFFGFAMTGVPRAAEEFWAAFAGVTLTAGWTAL